MPGTIGDRIANAYAEHLFGTTTLQDLPDEPRFVFNATNVQSGALWRFSKPYMGDYRVGLVENPTVRLAKAVAASAAFPPVLSPVTLELEPAAFAPGSGARPAAQPYTDEAVLSDGGVYDNLGLETVWKRYDTVLVSDGGGKMQPEGGAGDRLGAARAARARHHRQPGAQPAQAAADRLLQAGERKGAYWGIRTNIADYGLPDALPCPHERTTEARRGADAAQAPAGAAAGAADQLGLCGLRRRAQEARRSAPCPAARLSPIRRQPSELGQLRTINPVYLRPCGPSCRCPTTRCAGWVAAFLVGLGPCPELRVGPHQQVGRFHHSVPGFDLTT